MERFDPVQLYFKEIKNIPLIPKEDMPRLWKKAYAGDKKIQKKMVEANLQPGNTHSKKVFQDRH